MPCREITLPIDLVNLPIQCGKIIKHANQKKSARHQVQNTRDPFAAGKTMNAEDAEEGQQQPHDVIVQGGKAAWAKTGACAKASPVPSGTRIIFWVWDC
jgi:hypothetical protein